MKSIIAAVLLVLGASVADGKDTPEYVKDLRKEFNDDATGAYYRTLESPDDLESVSKSVFTYFVKSHRYTKEPQAYLEEWKKVFSSSEAEKPDDIFEKLHHPEDFHTALQMEMLLDNRDDAEQAQETFKKAFALPNNIKVEQFYLGDDDIMHGVMVAAVNKQNVAVFLVNLAD